MSTITNLSQDVTQYYITNKRKCENTKKYTIMNNTEGAYELQKKNSRDEQGGWKDRAPNGQLLIHDATAA